LPPPEDFPAECSSAEAASLLAGARALAHSVPPVLRSDLLKARRWACVALEDELEGDAVSRLAQACAAHGFLSGWSAEIPWAADGRTPATHRFAISARAFQFLSKDAYIGSCFVLAETAGGFALASDGDLYWMVAGPIGFVEHAAGQPIGDALTRFGRTALSYGNTVAGSRLAEVQAVALAACGAAQT
jgi:hypothetical protein